MICNAHAGSPPRLRGILGRQWHGSRQARFTPAPAGNTSVPVNRFTIASVHPRACGEYPRFAIASLLSIGSPPRLRGIPQGRVSAADAARFTPAPAGNTGSPRGRYHDGTVHPRACGEYTTGIGPRVVPHGSPPRLRGIRPEPAPTSPASRFTPAPAGNTSTRAVMLVCAAVHPRACGEYSPLALRCRLGRGSPPRLRGIRDVNLHRVPIIRFTPAPAGNTRGSLRHDGQVAVHPRACGEYISQF